MPIKGRNKASDEDIRKQRDAAYERGWIDSLSAYDNLFGQPTDDKFYYHQGWQECAKYRWEDPVGRGVAPDPTFRRPYCQ